MTCDYDDVDEGDDYNDDDDYDDDGDVDTKESRFRVWEIGVPSA